MKPIWQPGKPSHYGERFFFFSPKLQRQVAVSSKLEMDRARLLELDPNVINYCEQPCEAVAVIDGKIRKSRIDFWVELASGECRFEEVKYEVDLRDPQSRAHQQIKIQKIWCAEHGYTHVVITDRIIWANPTLNNSARTLLCHFTRRYVLQIDAVRTQYDCVISSIQKNGTLTVGEAFDRRPNGVPRYVYNLAVLDLIRIGRLDAQIAAIPFGPRSKISRKDSHETQNN